MARVTRPGPAFDPICSTNLRMRALNFFSSKGACQSSNDDEFVEAAQLDEPSATLRSLYDRFHSKLVAFLHDEFGPGPPHPDDIAHQAFSKLLERDDLEEIRDLEAFVWVVAANMTRTELRALRVRNAYAEDQKHIFWGGQCDEFDPERVLSAREELEIISRTLRTMPERRRKVFMACRFEGMNPAEAGRSVGISRNAAVRHISIATALIVEALAKKDTDPS